MPIVDAAYVKSGCCACQNWMVWLSKVDAVNVGSVSCQNCSPSAKGEISPGKVTLTQFGIATTHVSVSA